MESIAITVKGVNITAAGIHHKKDVEAGQLENWFEIERIDLENPFDLLVNGITLDQVNEEVDKQL